MEEHHPLLPWLAIVAAWVCFGSMAVPMKFQSVVDAQVHPMIFQLYKTFWTFVTSHLVLIVFPYEFTWWGILSGLCWVPAGIAAIFAVQNIGIAYGQATWQVTIIFTSCVWGFAIFQNEQVRNWWVTGFAMFCLVLGVVGMTLSFNLQKATSSDSAEEDLSNTFSSGHGSELALTPTPDKQQCIKEKQHLDERLQQKSPVLGGSSSDIRRSLSDVRFAADGVGPKSLQKPSATLGLAAAIFNGTWGGSNLVPSKFAPLHGVHFAISFATGALIINAIIFGIYVFWVKLVKGGSVPSLQLRVMAIPGFLSGTLWSAGNFCSLYVVSTIGQGIGYSLVQSSVICSGLWGILLYREMSGRPVLYWSLCCGVCLSGVILLALQKMS